MIALGALLRRGIDQAVHEGRDDYAGGGEFEGFFAAWLEEERWAELHEPLEGRLVDPRSLQRDLRPLAEWSCLQSLTVAEHCWVARGGLLRTYRTGQACHEYPRSLRRLHWSSRLPRCRRRQADWKAKYFPRAFAGLIVAEPGSFAHLDQVG